MRIDFDLTLRCEKCQSELTGRYNFLKDTLFISPCEECLSQEEETIISKEKTEEAQGLLEKLGDLLEELEEKKEEENES